MNFNKFWLRSVDEDKLFIEIQTELNSLDREIEEFSDFTEVQIGQVVAAGHNGVYYRARVVSCVRANKIFFNVNGLILRLTEFRKIIIWMPCFRCS